MTKRMPSHTTVVAYLALTIAVIGVPFAWALGKNSVGAKQIKSNAVGASEIADRAVGTGEVADGSLKSGDFAAGELPQGAQGPTGETGSPGSLDITGGTSLYGSCTIDNSAPAEGAPGYAQCGNNGSVTLARPGRIFVIATGSWFGIGGSPASGRCRLQVNGSAIAGPADIEMGELTNNSSDAGAEQRFTIQDLSGALPAGTHSFGLQCQEQIADMDWADIKVSGVALGG